MWPRDPLPSATVTAAAGVLVLLLGVGSATAETRSCKNTYGGDVISASNVGCKNARAVVRAWASAYKQDGDPNQYALGFQCKGRNDQVEGLTITCRREGARIRFFANVP